MITTGGGGADPAWAAPTGVIVHTSGRGNYTTLPGGTVTCYPAFAINNTAVNKASRIYLDRTGAIKTIRFIGYTDNNASNENHTLSYRINAGNWEPLTTTYSFASSGTSVVQFSVNEAVSQGDYVMFRLITPGSYSTAPVAAYQADVVLEY